MNNLILPFPELVFRASSLSDLMTEPKAKSETLSAGAKTAVIKMAREALYGYTTRIQSKYLTKGIQCEDESIGLLNQVLFTDYKKNTERRHNDWITGEADLVCDDCIRDIKTSWSLETFPIIAELGEDKGYFWQMQAYMWLWDKPRAEVCYCMVNTPEELVGYEDKTLHIVNHIPPEMRVTRVFIERDNALEDKIKSKVEAAREFYFKIIEQVAKEHKFTESTK